MIYPERSNHLINTVFESGGGTLDASTCRDIVSWAEEAGFRKAMIRTAKGVRLEEEVRVADEVVVDFNSAPERITSALRHVATEVGRANQDIWQFELSRTTVFGVIRYGLGHHFMWHTDLVEDHSTRKLGAILQLTDGGEYRGGDLEYGVSPTRKAGRDIGNLVAFPSWMPHRVTPVESGVRYSVAFFVLGPRFR